MVTSKKKPHSVTFKETLIIIFWVLKLVYRFAPTLIIAVLIIQIFTTVVPFVEQKFLSNLIDSLISSLSQKSTIWINIFLIFIGIRIFKIILHSFQRILQRILDIKVQNDLRKFYLTRTSQLDYQQFEDREIASLMAKVNEEYAWRTRQVIGDIFDLITQSLSFITVIIILLPNYWYLAILLFIGEIPSLLIDRKWQKIDFQMFNHYNELSRPGWDAAWQLVDKKFTAELRINNATNWLKSKFTDIQDEFTKTRIHNRREKFPADILASLISITIGGLAMIFIIKDINSGYLTVGMFTFYFGIIRSTGDYFAGFMNRFVSINEQVLHINNFKKIVELPEAIPNGSITKGLTGQPKIEFRNVSFRYPNTKKFIYKNLNLIIKPGEEIAIVGPNGAGKSTLIKLICRFYDPTNGEILINDINLIKYDIKYWYRHLSLLTQEFNTYPNLTLRENVTIGNIDNDQKIISALIKSEAYDFIKKYPKGLDTMMSQRYGGEEPSWGQWQKIAISRIFYKNTPVMILDEPTASIDAVAESKIFARLFKTIKQKTLIIISHRYSTVRKAQRIIVINNGQIIEQGSHQELINLKGLYAKSFNLQAKGYTG